MELAPGTKLILTLLAAVVFCLALVYAANIETNNPQLMKIQSALNGAFDWVYRVFGSAFKSIGSLKNSRLVTNSVSIWDGVKVNVAYTGVRLLSDKAENAEYVRRELPVRLNLAYKNLVGYKEESRPVTAAKPKGSNIVYSQAAAVPTATPMPQTTPNPVPQAAAVPARVSLPSIRSASEAAVYYNPGGVSYHIKSTCYNMFSAESHTLAEAARDGKTACTNCSVPSLDFLSHPQTDYLWVDGKNIAHTSDLCVEFTGDYRLISFEDVYEGHYTYCPKCKADLCYEYIRQNDTRYNVQYDTLTAEEILLYEYEKTIEVYYTTNGRSYHSSPDCQQLYDDKYVHNLFEALHKDGMKPCSVCNPYNEADAREYLASHN